MKTKFYLKAKTARNLWVPIAEISARLFPYDVEYDSSEEANIAKGRVKSYLKTHEPKNKVPIKVVSLQK